MNGAFDDHSSLMEALARLPVTWDHKPVRAGPFSSRIRRFQRAGVIFAQMSVDACSSYRSFAKRPDAGEEYICIAAQMGGKQWFQQGAKELTVEAGDVFVWNARLPSISDCSDGLEGWTCMIPYSLVKRKIGDPGNFFGRKAHKDNPITRVLHSNIVALHRMADGIGDTSITQMISSIIEMLSCSIGGENDDFEGTRYQREIFNRLRQYIHDNLEDEALSVSSAAGALSIGTRSVQQVFMLAGTSFGAYLRCPSSEHSAQLAA
jgi:hypothetical protein